MMFLPRLRLLRMMRKIARKENPKRRINKNQEIIQLLPHLRLSEIACDPEPELPSVPDGRHRRIRQNLLFHDYRNAARVAHANGVDVPLESRGSFGPIRTGVKRCTIG